MIIVLRLGQNRKNINPQDVYELSKLGLTQAEVARRLKMRPETLSRRINESLELMQARHRGLREFKA
jgi:hypothetical protein